MHNQCGHGGLVVVRQTPNRGQGLEPNWHQVVS